MGTLATLTIDLVGQSAKLRADLGKASKDTKSWAEKTRAMVNTSAKAFTAMGIAGATAWAAIYAETSKTADQLAKTSDKLGILPEKLQALQHAGEQTGVEFEAVNDSLQSMVERISEAKEGTGEGAEALDRLGLSAKTLNELSPDQQFKAIADAMANVENRSDKVRTAIQLFGDSGAGLVNTLDLGSAGLNAMEAEVNALGIAMDRVSLAKIEMANDAFDKATKSTASFGNALTTSTAPIVGALSDMFTQAAMEAGGFGNIAQSVMKATVTSVGFVSDAGRGLKVVFLLLRQAVAELANEIIQLGTTSSKVGAAIADFFGFESSTISNINKFAESFQGTTDKLRQELADVVAEPMPSEKIAAWFDDVQQKFEYEAQKIAKDRKNNINIGATVTTDTETDSKDTKLIESTRKRHQEIYDAQLEQENRLQELEQRRFDRKMQQMDEEFALLREKNLVTEDLEAEHRAAKEQAEANHKARLAEIYEEHAAKKIEIEDRVNKTIGSMQMQVASQTFELIAQNAKEGSALQKAAFIASKTVAMAQAYINTELAAVSALAPPPVGLGPVAGMPYSQMIRGLGYTSIALMGAQTLASFDGGGYTWDGPRVGGIDGKGGRLAILHSQETVVDHTKGQSIGGSVNKSVTIENINLTVVTRSYDEVRDEVAAVIPDLAGQIKYYLSRPM